MIRRRKEDVLKDLPPKQRVLIPVEITNREKYSTTELDVIAWFRERAGNDQRFLEKIAYMNTADRAIEIERHQNSAEERARRAEAMVRIEALKQVSAEGKLEPVSEWIDNFLVSGEKLVIFANHIHIQKSIREKYKALSIIGEDSIEERQAAVNKFQTDPNAKVIVCSIKAGGLGITLTAANTVDFYRNGMVPRGDVAMRATAFIEFAK